MITRDSFWENMNISKLEEKGNSYLLFLINIFRDGPAIWVNDTLERGQTNCSATFGNQLLNGGVKGKDEQYDIHNFELYIL